MTFNEFPFLLIRIRQKPLIFNTSKRDLIIKKKTINDKMRKLFRQTRWSSLSVGENISVTLFVKLNTCRDKIVFSLCDSKYDNIIF